jgi:Lrp/AsnC family leucine-responsive transcriptional regulator
MITKRKQGGVVTFRGTSPLLDTINVTILAQLCNEPRIALRALARRVKMSAPAVTERVLRLREAKVIRREWLDIDPCALGLSITAYVNVRPVPGALPKIIELARATPEVVECHRVTGDDCFIMKVLAADIIALEAVLDRFLLFGTTSSSLIVSSPVPLRNPPLPQAGA